MAVRKSTSFNKFISLLASVVLVIGLLPVSAVADDSASGAEGAAPEAASTVEATPAAEVAPAPEPILEPVPEASEAVPVPEAVPAPNAVEGATPAPDGAPEAEGEKEAASAPKVAPATEDKAKEAGAEEGKTTKDGTKAEKKKDAKHGTKVKEEKDAKESKSETKDKKVEYPAFSQTRTASGVVVSVAAAAGVFPEGAQLHVAAAPQSATEAAVAAERDAGANVAASYTFDIKVLDKDGKELQPPKGKSAQVSFRAAEVADPNLDVSVYHISDGTADELSVKEFGSTATAPTTGFSYYTVEFTYGDLQYVMNGGESVALADILSAVGLAGEPTDVRVSNTNLFSASKETGAWVITSHQPFSTNEWMLVTIAGVPYKIAVTDEQGTYTSSDGITYSYDTESATAIVDYNLGNSLADVTIPATITVNGVEYEVIGVHDYAFRNNENIMTLTFKGDVGDVGIQAVYKCPNLKTVTFEGDVGNIGFCAFWNCQNLSSVSFLGSVGSIGVKAFGESPSLTDVYYDGYEAQWREITFSEDWFYRALGLDSDLKVHCKYSVTAAPATGGTVEGDAIIVYNKSGEPKADAPVSATVKAVATDGFKFAKWTSEADMSFDDSTDPETSLTTFAESATAVANFENEVLIGPADGAIGDPIADQVYTGNAIEPALKVELKGLDVTLKKGDDYDITYDKNVDAGTATATVTLKGKWAGSGSITFNITKREVSVSVADAADVVYDGAEHKGKTDLSFDNLCKDHEATITYTPATGTKAGTYEGSFGDDFIVTSGDVNVTANYVIANLTPGKLTITEKPAPPTKEYTIEFVNEDGTVLQSGKVKEGETPEYTGETPTKPADEEYTYTFAGWTPEIAPATADATYTAKYTKKKKTTYKVVEGAGSEYTQGSDGTLTFVFKRSENDETTFDHFTRAKYDGKLLTKDKHYTAAKGSVIIELQPALLETLSVGKHTLTAEFDDADPVTVEFTVKAKASSKTGTTASTAKTGDEMRGATATASTIALFTALLVVVSAAAFHRRREE